jgi:hypothetical protein
MAGFIGYSGNIDNPPTGSLVAPLPEPAVDEEKHLFCQVLHFGAIVNERNSPRNGMRTCPAGVMDCIPTPTHMAPTRFEKLLSETRVNFPFSRLEKMRSYVNRNLFQDWMNYRGIGVNSLVDPVLAQADHCGRMDRIRIAEQVICNSDYC